MQLNLLPVVLEEAFMISSKVKHFVFKAPLPESFHYLPGQFITIHFEKDGKTLKRSYSIANPPLHDNRIEFAAGYVENGPGTELLFNLQPGDTIHINGPFGRLILKDPLPKRYLFISTSTGITPYRAMLPLILQQIESNASLKIVMLHGVQYREDVLYKEEFLKIQTTYPQFQFRLYLSREKQPHQDEMEYQGYVQHAFPHLSLNPDNDKVYLCGNPGMIDAAFNDLKNIGFTTTNVIREKYISN